MGYRTIFKEADDHLVWSPHDEMFMIFLVKTKVVARYHAQDFEQALHHWDTRPAALERRR